MGGAAAGGSVPIYSPRIPAGGPCLKQTASGRVHVQAGVPGCSPEVADGSDTGGEMRSNSTRVWHGTLVDAMLSNQGCTTRGGMESHLTLQ